MNTNCVLKTVVVTLIACLCLGTAQAQDSAETLAEQERARAAEQNPSAGGNPQAPSPPEGPAEPGPLFAGVDDVAIDAVRIDVATNAFTTAFSGVQVWGSAYDADNDRVLFNSGSTLWEWPVGGAPNMLGTVVNGAGAAQAMVGLAWYNGTLYGTKNIAPEAIHTIDPDTLLATVFIDYDDAADLGGLAVDQATGAFYATDDGANDALVRVNPDASIDVIAAYPVGQTDIDGLAVGGGRAYLVTDDAGGPIYVYDFAGAAYDTPLTNPWPTSETFAAGAWIEGEGGGGGEARATFPVTKDFDDNNPAEVSVTISCNTGLPLEQTTTISEGAGVVFVVTDFNDGEMDCEISEDPVPAGYLSVYYENAVLASTESCVFENVGFGDENSCGIENLLQQVDVVVTKEWIDENPQFNAINLAEAEWECSNVASGDDEGLLEFFGNPGEDSFSVFPSWDGGTDCSVAEVSIPDGGVEIDDSACDLIVVFPGAGGSCTIVNTRLFEGIPTLSPYGLALLAMLMLGLGFAAVRRFA